VVPDVERDGAHHRDATLGRHPQIEIEVLPVLTCRAVAAHLVERDPPEHHRGVGKWRERRAAQ
jgi:hypothetical protein